MRTAALWTSVFWGSVGAIAYTYVGFPTLVLLRGALRTKPYVTADIEPPVSIVIAARNEEAGIGAKLENLAALDYPGDRLETIVASDGSEDSTEQIVRRYADRGVRLLALPRVGKAAALNAAVAVSAGEILVFSDANSMLAPDAIRALARPFADPAVGGVAGDQRYLPPGGAPQAGRGERSYWDFDRRLKEAESRAGNAISATGAIYAIRRSLFRPVPEGVTDDFATSTAVIAQGARLVFAGNAIAYEPVARSGSVEFGRKVRVMTRGLRGVFVRRELLDPRRHGFYALQLLSHKVLRRLMVFPLAAIAISSRFMWSRGPTYRVATIGQAVFYGLAAAGVASAGRPLGRHKLLALPAFFCLVNAASLQAAWNVATGRRIDRWEPQRETPASRGSGDPGRA